MLDLPPYFGSVILRVQQELWLMHPAFIYTYAGTDFPAPAAERLISQQGNANGWTWRSINRLEQL